jgi:putative ABC transport system substrate-binding protein
MQFDRLKRRAFITLLGSAMAWPVLARGQPSTIPVIGFLSPRSPEAAVQVNAAFREGLREAGFIEGENVSIEYRFAAGRFDLLPALATDLVSQRVAVIAAPYPSGRAAKAATDTIPIVFIGGSDPVVMGLVASMNRPGGNITGVSLLAADLETKRIGLLREMLPQTARISALIDRTDPNVYPETERSRQELQAAAARLGVSIQFVSVGADRDLDNAFDELIRNRGDALVVAASTFFNINRDRLVALSARYNIPTIYELREFAAAGGLMTYAPSLLDAYKQGGTYAGRILKGEKPADMPVLLPTRFELVVNLKTAKALGLTVPDKLLALADELIE